VCSSFATLLPLEARRIAARAFENDFCNYRRCNRTIVFAEAVIEAHRQ
jgi:hypothetical protein